MPGGRPRKQADCKDRILTLMLSQEEHNALKDLAERNNQTHSDYIRSRLFPIVAVNDSPPSGANPRFKLENETLEIRLVYVIENSGLFVTHLCEHGRMTKMFGASNVFGGEPVLFYREEPIIETKDEYGTKILLHVDKVEGNVGDLEISISGWDVNGCVEIKQYADGRPEEVRQIK